MTSTPIIAHAIDDIETAIRRLEKLELFAEYNRTMKFDDKQQMQLQYVKQQLVQSTNILAQIGV